MITGIFMPPEGDTIEKTYIWTLLSGLLFAGSPFVMAVLVSNRLGAAAAGVFAIALSIGNQLVALGLYNVRMFQITDVQEKYSFGDYAGLRALSTIAMVLIGVVWILLEGYRGEKLATIMLMIVFKAGDSVSDLFEGRYQQKKRFDVSGRGKFVKTLLPLVGFLLLLFFTGNLLWAMIVLDVLYWGAMLIIDGVLIRWFGGFQIRLLRDNIYSLLFNCFPLFLNVFLMVYIVNASRYSMEQYYSDKYLGTYNALYMMAFVVTMLSDFLLKPLSTPLAIKYQKGDYKGFSIVIRRQILFITLVTLAMVIGAYVMGIPILSWVFAVDLQGYRFALCIILAGGAFTAVFQLLLQGLTIMRHQLVTLVGGGVTSLLTFMFTPVLVKAYGILGGAISYFASMASMAFLFSLFYMYYLRKDKKEKKLS